ncbi:uncharacterized protein BXZ73DRAFT_83184 [Epithele typhae]|uniref:uncharacterized protein n=1 Tax=Epithele typhae TaxID=378194 RepID=UPI002007E56F|nr:uncharacterized protein BXZ73DRAFT_83184 [Epithele typhae]KAH9910796.1 hypothetical protein BXZ73DRAFT_83184 [Epithele typhae]
MERLKSLGDRAREEEGVARGWLLSLASDGWTRVGTARTRLCPYEGNGDWSYLACNRWHPPFTISASIAQADKRLLLRATEELADAIGGHDAGITTLPSWALGAFIEYGRSQQRHGYVSSAFNIERFSPDNLSPSDAAMVMGLVCKDDGDAILPLNQIDLEWAQAVMAVLLGEAHDGIAVPSRSQSISGSDSAASGSESGSSGDGSSDERVADRKGMCPGLLSGDLSHLGPGALEKARRPNLPLRGPGGRGRGGSQEARRGFHQCRATVPRRRRLSAPRRPASHACQSTDRLQRAPKIDLAKATTVAQANALWRASSDSEESEPFTGSSDDGPSSDMALDGERPRKRPRKTAHFADSPDSHLKPEHRASSIPGAGQSDSPPRRAHAGGQQFEGHRVFGAEHSTGNPAGGDRLLTRIAALEARLLEQASGTKALAARVELLEDRLERAGAFDQGLWRHGQSDRQ